MKLFKKNKANDYVVLTDIKITYNFTCSPGYSLFSINVNSVKCDNEELVYAIKSDTSDTELCDKFLSVAKQPLNKICKKLLIKYRKDGYHDYGNDTGVFCGGKHIIRCVPTVQVTKTRSMTKKEYKNLK